MVYMCPNCSKRECNETGYCKECSDRFKRWGMSPVVLNLEEYFPDGLNPSSAQ